MSHDNGNKGAWSPSWQPKAWGVPGPARWQKGERDWWHLSCRRDFERSKGAAR